MALWKKEVGDSAGERPNWLSDDEKSRCYCDDRGWVLVHLDGREEVLVAGSSLNQSTDDSAGDAIERSTASAAALSQRTGDLDSDGTPNYMDPDIDGDGVVNSEDDAPYDSTNS